MDNQVVKLAKETLGRHKALTDELSDPNIYSDQRRYAEVAKEHARMRRGAEMSKELLNAIEEGGEARELPATARGGREGGMRGRRRGRGGALDGRGGRGERVLRGGSRNGGAKSRGADREDPYRARSSR